MSWWGFQKYKITVASLVVTTNTTHKQKAQKKRDRSKGNVSRSLEEFSIVGRSFQHEKNVVYQGEGRPLRTRREQFFLEQKKKSNTSSIPPKDEIALNRIMEPED